MSRHREEPSSAAAPPQSNAVLITLGTRSVALRPERAAIDIATGTALVADLHLDKPASYRREGVAMPEGILEESLDRLARLAERPDVAEIVVLGDLLHHRHGADPETADRFARWRRTHPIGMRLVGGNHDRGAARHLDDWGIEPAGAVLRLDGLELHHDPRSAVRTPAVAGHLHPVAAIDRGSRRLKLPVFLERRGILVLPAFTAFASGDRVRATPGSRIHAIAEGRVLDVTGLWRA